MFELAPEQRQAVQYAQDHRVSILTGGPGTGKSAVTREIIRVLCDAELSVACCAPTGKAAMRLQEQTEYPASTIHRLLGARPDGSFVRNEDEPLMLDVLIVDEFSMVPTELAYALMSAVPKTAKLIIVGDVDQLPSIGAGRVLHDLIASDVFPVTRLTKIFRQASDSSIPWVARDFNSGAMPEFTAKDAFWADAKDPYGIEPGTAALQGIVSAFQTHLPAMGYEPHEIQAICPQRNHVCGVTNVNNVLQQILNPDSSDESQTVRVGNDYRAARSDRVIHTQNNYSLGVMNGEIGTVCSASWKGMRVDHPDVLCSSKEGPVSVCDADSLRKYVLVVEYDQRRVAYTQAEAYELQLAYAVTVHKFQGSQAPAVIMPVHSVHHYMLTRPLVYTGITRAQRQLIMLGEPSALEYAATNTRGVTRRTTLVQALQRLAA